jgi:hypothetical protein
MRTFYDGIIPGILPYTPFGAMAGRVRLARSNLLPANLSLKHIHVLALARRPLRAPEAVQKIPDILSNQRVRTKTSLSAKYKKTRLMRVILYLGEREKN